MSISVCCCLCLGGDIAFAKCPADEREQRTALQATRSFRGGSIG